MTKIDVISGFLGAGKTTFIRRLLGEALKNEKTVLIENEFGEIGIDGGFLKEYGIEIREMSQGCICCSLVGDFEKSLKAVIEQYHPDRIIIEPSGVGKLSDIMKAVTEASASMPVVLNSAVTVVDAGKCKMYMKNFGEFFNNQVQYAGTIVLTRTDLVSHEKVKEATELIRQVNPSAEIITTPVSELSGGKLLAVIEKRDDMLEELRREALNVPDGESEEEHEHHHHHHDDGDDDEDEHEHHHHHHDDDEDDEDEHEHHHHHHDDDEDDEDEHEHRHHHHDDDDDEDEHEHHHHHHDDDEHEHHHHHHHYGHDADEIFESFGQTGVAPMTREKLDRALSELSGEGDAYGTVLRAKGMVQSADADGWYHFDLTPGETEVRMGSADYTGKVCVIGSGLKEDRIRELFA